MTVRTVPGHDELEHGGESLVLIAGQVHRVSPVGTLIRSRARRGAGATTEQLAEALVERFGAPPDGDALEITRQAVGTLLEAGLLEAVAQ